MQPLSSPPEATSRSTIRRRIGRYMITGGLLGWGVVVCVVAGASSPPETWLATFWFTAAFIVMLFLLGFLIKGYRLEDKHNPNFDPQERAQVEAQAGSDPRPTAGITSASGEAGNTGNK